MQKYSVIDKVNRAALQALPRRRRERKGQRKGMQIVEFPRENRESECSGWTVSRKLQLRCGENAKGGIYSVSSKVNRAAFAALAAFAFLILLQAGGMLTVAIG
jgi:hypothetical protein